MTKTRHAVLYSHTWPDDVVSTRTLFDSEYSNGEQLTDLPENYARFF